jgi:DNA-binding transcriptional MerR regulator/methylmalonyl-CoA mutase cobalamin-binding subunit
MSSRKEHPIHVVSTRTGLSQHVIRAWEKRYRAVNPSRTGGNRRLYSDEDVERLILLKRAIQSGRSIGQIASLSTERLVSLIEPDVSIPGPKTSNPEGDSSLQERLQTCIETIERLDADALMDELYRGNILFGQTEVLERLIVPLMREIGDRWRAGTLRIFHEHLASVVTRNFLGNLLKSMPYSKSSPKAVSATLSGEMHELGALASAVVAASEGWKVSYLGPNLPPEEIVRAAQMIGTSVVLISSSFTVNAELLSSGLRTLRRFLPVSIRILVGGSGVKTLERKIVEDGATVISDFKTLRDTLRTLLPHAEGGILQRKP